MTYDVKTPVLADIAAVENEVIKAVGMDVKARLALPKISALEAKLIEQSIEKAA
jgi:hypothetical protein